MNNTRALLGMAVSTALLAGCGGSDNTLESASDDDQNDQFSRKVIDARSEEKAAYLNLETGSVVHMSDEEARQVTNWHLAFKRDSVQLNGGASGEGEVAGALLNPQDKYYKDNGDPDFNLLVNASAELEEGALLKNYPAPGRRDWVKDSVSNSFGDDWRDYNHDNGVMSANPNNGWLVRSAEGDSYARLQVTQLDFPTREGKGVKSFTIEMDVQAADTSQFAPSPVTFTGSIGAEGGELCFDFDAGSPADCTGATWDVKFGFGGRDTYLKSNSGASGDGNGGVFGPFKWDVLKDYSSATTEPLGQDITGRYEPDTTGGIFSQSSWYVYDQAGGHLLRPNFRVYAIDTDATDPAAPVYAVQIAGYYGEDKEYGQTIVRWTEASLTEGDN
ncbi:MAG: hypothetical protein HLX50_03555 [Alteromonadaceae bacterium]|nr:hypothetical protein [Alteromonadaceae bacterium]